MKHHFIREKVESKEIDTIRVNTKENLADVLTKALPRATHEEVTRRMNMGREERGELSTTGKVVHNSEVSDGA